jgi:O-antigen/teichoic acid export membrane protein
MALSNATAFMLGRALATIVLVIVQIVVVRVLSPTEYAHYALVFACAALMQTVVSFGIPRLIPKIFSLVDVAITGRQAQVLVVKLLGCRVLATGVALVLGYALGRWLGLVEDLDPSLVAVGALYIVISTMPTDLDAMAQALELQVASRNCLVGEALARVCIMLTLSQLGALNTAFAVLAVTTCTSFSAAAILLKVVRVALRRRQAELTGDFPTPAELRQIGLASYASSMAWFASSPFMLRLIGGYILPTIVFAGYAFMQNLMLSIQRYTPGSQLFPFVEPAVMRDFARSGDKKLLEAALSLTSKADLIFAGGGFVGAVISGQAIVGLLTEDKYSDLAYALPFLLVYIATMSLYRSFEIIAVIFNASATLTWSFGVSIIWLVILLLVAPKMGLIALLTCPICEAGCRLALMYRSLHKLGIRSVLDLRVTATVLGSAFFFSFAGREAAAFAGLGPAATISIGVAGALLYSGAVLIMKPITTQEALVLTSGRNRRLEQVLRRFIYRYSDTNVSN